MSCKAMHIAAIFAGGVGFLFIIVALSAPAWIQGCMPMDNIFKAMKNLLTSQGQEIPERFDTQVNMMKGMAMCIKQGLFKVSMSVMNVYDVNVPVDFLSLPRYILITALGLILAAIFGLISVIMLIVVVNQNTGDYEQSSKNNRVAQKALMFAIVAGVFCLGGMATYSVGSSRIVHSPIAFIAEFGTSVSGSVTKMFQNQQIGGGLSRGKRDIDLDSLPLDPAMKEYITTMFGSLDPVYSYSFILGWLSVVFILIQVVLVVVIRMRGSQHTYDNPPIKM